MQATCSLTCKRCISTTCMRTRASLHASLHARSTAPDIRSCRTRAMPCTTRLSRAIRWTAVRHAWKMRDRCMGSQMRWWRTCRAHAPRACCIRWSLHVHMHGWLNLQPGSLTFNLNHMYHPRHAHARLAWPNHTLRHSPVVHSAKPLLAGRLALDTCALKPLCCSTLLLTQREAIVKQLLRLIRTRLTHAKQSRQTPLPVSLL